MPVDPSANITWNIENANRRIEQLKAAHPETYFLEKEYMRLRETLRMAEIEIRHIDFMKKAGAKF